MKIMETENSSKPSEFCFEWCFKPYIAILKLLTGAPVDRSTSTQKSKGFFPYCLAFYGAILLLVNALINIRYLYGYISNNFLLNQTDTLSSQQLDNLPHFKFQPENNKTKTQSDYISMGIDMANEVFMVFGSHLCFFLVFFGLGLLFAVIQLQSVFYTVIYLKYINLNRSSLAIYFSVSL